MGGSPHFALIVFPEKAGMHSSRQNYAAHCLEPVLRLQIPFVPVSCPQQYIDRYADSLWLPLQFGFNNGQTMVDGLYAGNTSQVQSPSFLPHKGVPFLARCAEAFRCHLNRPVKQ